ncbi:TetR/AcrR family transcriptional regulator [Agrobacterium vaccinii]|uniref:TetR/AcrR family transcriptional regulator n=1 Tax=Agrobacterium vaccinii TaxID=2735528 RepID=UPI001E460B61|nr:TetR/AcrR family transcriptional regulator [Agrobacterium vaccinii]UHS59783.1 TetR/AcrR family transcriptional regulator [Agrobacterium vaccinii]
MSNKLPRADRRAQLLETARDMVRELGTDALTLGALAERAGVSRPITYSHFETRAGLFIALYKEMSDHQLRDLAEAVHQTPAKLEDVARVIAQAYIDCQITVAPQAYAIAAALKGDPEMEAFQREVVTSHVEFCCRVLSPLSPLSDEIVRRRCAAIIGSVEALSQELLHGLVKKEDVVDDLSSLISIWLDKPRCSKNDLNT